MRPNNSRSAAALVIAITILVTLASMAFVLSGLTINRYKEQQARQAQVLLLAASESAANEALSWMQNNQAVLDYLRAMPVSSLAFPTTAVSTAAVLVSNDLSVLAVGTPAMYPALANGGAGNAANLRNTLQVQSKIIKVSDANIGSWPDGDERFMIFSTAAAGGNVTGSAITRADDFRRQRISALVKVGVVNNNVFRQAMFSHAGYNVSGTAKTDSWRSSIAISAVTTGLPGTGTISMVGDMRKYFDWENPSQPYAAASGTGTFTIEGAAYTVNAGTNVTYDSVANVTTVRPSQAVPASVAVSDSIDFSYTQGKANGFGVDRDASNLNGYAYNDGDISSNGLVTANTPSNVHGDIYPYANQPLPVITYNPPASATSIPAISGNFSYTHNGSGIVNIRTPQINQGNNQALTINGNNNGTVRLWVNGQMEITDLNFVAGSNVKVEIYQDNYAITNNRSSIGKAQSAFGDPADPARVLIFTNYSGTGTKELGLNGGTSFSAVMYAPYAGIKLNGGSDFFGSIVTRDMSGTVNGNFAFHYDEALANLPIGLATPRLTAASWHPRNLSFGEL